MNRINPKKLHSTRWTKRSCHDKEKHFIVNAIEFDETERVIGCVLEAIINKNEYEIDWRELKDDDIWIHGWL